MLADSKGDADSRERTHAPAPPSLILLGRPLHPADVCHPPQKRDQTDSPSPRREPRGADKKAGDFLPGRNPLSFLVAHQLQDCRFFFRKVFLKKLRQARRGSGRPSRSRSRRRSGRRRLRDRAARRFRVPAARARRRGVESPHARRVALVPPGGPRATEWAMLATSSTSRGAPRRLHGARAVPPGASPWHRAVQPQLGRRSDELKLARLAGLIPS